AIAGATIVLTRQAVRDWRTLGVALVAALLLWRFKIKEPVLVLLAAAAGILLHGLTSHVPGKGLDQRQATLRGGQLQVFDRSKSWDESNDNAEIAYDGSCAPSIADDA